MTGSPTRPPAVTRLPPPDADAVCDAFGLGRPRARATFAARGELGRIWRLEASTGTWAIKEALVAVTEEAAATDVAFQSAALSAGVPMPRPMLARDGRVLAQVPAGDRSPWVRVYAWVELAADRPPVAAGEAAAILGRLHGLAYPDGRAPDAWFAEPVETARWEAILSASDDARSPWAPTLASLIPDLVAGDPVIHAGRHTPTIRCHRDFNRENVLLDAAGRAVVVDWENSGPAASEQELASALAEFVADPSGTRDFLHAYASAGGTARLRDRASFAMTLAFQENLVAFYAERALDPASSDEDRVRSAHWIRDIAANAFTVERIDGWLAAAREA